MSLPPLPLPLPLPSPVAATHLLYLHGFRSSPLSFKSRRLKQWLAVNRPQVNFWCPQLPPSPREALRLMRDGTQHWPKHGSMVLGSSLGGFYATVMAEATGWPCVVMNPAVDPARDLVGHVGELESFHQPAQLFTFHAHYLDELRAMAPRTLTQLSRYAALIAKGDELLDWREMSGRYAGARLRLIEGSDHALSDFDDHLSFVLDCLNLNSTCD